MREGGLLRLADGDSFNIEMNQSISDCVDRMGSTVKTFSSIQYADIF